jgi:hypothetical protein
VLDYRLPDGTWVTTPVCIGSMSNQCPDDCVWEDQGPPTEEGPIPVQLQRCARCGWVRGKYLGVPDHARDN